MIGLDLSRAFDKLPRWALQASLEHASIDPAVCGAVIQIHERCLYKIRSISMRRGIRQGCSLSPTLYSIFTIWVFDRLSEITSPEWAQACITLFADDSHLAWLISSQQDFDFTCQCIRRTVDLFRSVGVDVNPSKSTFVLQIRGSTAKRWIQAHQQQSAKGPVIDVGLPHAPLLVPRAKHMMTDMGEDSRASMAQEELRLVLGGGGLQSMAVDGQSAASREEPGGGGGSGAERLLVRSRPEVVANGLRQGTLKEKRLGSSRDGWGSGWGNKWQWQKDTEDKEEAVLDKATQEVIKSLVQLSLRHEAELGRLRADCGCSWTQSRPIRLRACKPRIKEMATEWSTQYAAGTVKSPLRNLLMLAVIKELRGRLTTFLQDEERCGKEKRQEKTDQQPMHSTALQAQLQLLEETITKEGVLLNFRSTKDLEKEQDLEVIPFMERSLQAYWGKDQARKTGSPTGGQAAGGELSVHTVLPMKPPRFPLRPHPGLGRPEEAAGQREPSFVSVGAPQTTAQALYWMGAMSSHPAGAYGGSWQARLTLPTRVTDSGGLNHSKRGGITPASDALLSPLLPFPPDVYTDALEEALLLHAAARLLEAQGHGQVPPAMGLAVRNDIISCISWALQVLEPDCQEAFKDYAQSLNRHLRRYLTNYMPEPLGEPGPQSPAAETLAWHFLADGRATLWGAVRQAVAALDWHAGRHAFSGDRKANVTMGAYGKGELWLEDGQGQCYDDTDMGMRCGRIIRLSMQRQQWGTGRQGQDAEGAGVGRSSAGGVGGGV
ncbi:unnamed protein product [Symbiodinium microadriaticum]|nr:unnamed protein product [Symbiodinium microadriaticum]